MAEETKKAKRTVPLWLAVTLVCLAVVVTFIATNSANEAAMSYMQRRDTALGLRVALTEPKHRYSHKEGFEYSYEKALSEADKTAGAVATPMITIEFLGHRDGRFQVQGRENAVTSFVFECSRVCEVATLHQFVGEQVMGKTQIRSAPGSVVEAIFQDAAAGKLTEKVFAKDGKPHRGWLDKEGKLTLTRSP